MHTSQYFSSEQNPQSLGDKHPTHFKTPVNLYRTGEGEQEGKKGFISYVFLEILFSVSQNWKEDYRVFSQA